MADRVPTIADLCCAISEGHIDTTVEGTTYRLSRYELRRYLNRFRSLPAISPRITQVLSSHSDCDTWSAVSAQTSLA